MNALEQLSLNDDWDYHVALGTLSEEIRKLRGLRELHALKLANRCQRKDLEEIKEQVKQTKNELLNLMLKVKNFTGQAISRRCEVTSLAQFQSFAAVTNELNSQFESKKSRRRKSSPAFY